MKNVITITIEVEVGKDGVPLAAGKAAYACGQVKDRIADYLHAAYTSVLGPDGITFEPRQGGCAELGDDAYTRVNIREE